MITLLALVFLLMAVLEVPPLWRERKWGEVAAFFLVWGAALAFDLALALGARLPNPTQGIEWAAAHLQKLIFGN